MPTTRAAQPGPFHFSYLSSAFGSKSLRVASSFPDPRERSSRTRPRRRNDAVKSLYEGFEETLTLHRLGVFGTLGISLKTTNCLESINALVGQRTGKITHWRTSDQKHRWLAAALLDIEPRLRRIKGFRGLPLLRQALLAEVQAKAGTTRIQAA